MAYLDTQNWVIADSEIDLKSKWSATGSKAAAQANKSRDDDDGGQFKRFCQLIHKRLEMVCG